MDDIIRCPHCQMELKGVLLRKAVKSLMENKGQREAALRQMCPHCKHVIESADFLVDSEEDVLRRWEPGICWYCGLRQAEEGAASSVVLNKMLSFRVHQDPIGDTVASTEYNRQTVKVARCGECARLHGHRMKFQRIGCFGFGLIGFLLLLLVGFRSGDSMISWLLIAGGAALLFGYLGLTLAEVLTRLPAGVLPVEHVQKAPIVAELLKEGWKIGSEPEKPDIPTATGRYKRGW